MGSKELDTTAAAPPQSIQVNLGCTNNCFKYVFGFGCVSLHCCSQDFSGCGGHGVLSSFRVQPAHCGEFSCRGAQALAAVAHGHSSYVSWVLQLGLSSSAAWA